MKKAYDRTTARQLVPLLESITREVVDRLHEVRLLQGKLALLEQENQRVGLSAEKSGEFLELRAVVANHRRQIRLAMKELERLGCVVDEDNPLLIFIPGTDGNIDHGFQWDPSDPTLRRAATGTAVS